MEKMRNGPAPSPAAHMDRLNGGGMFRSLRVRNYRLYASGQLVSLTGTWMQRVAQDWLVLDLTNSGTALGIVTALQFGPTLVLGLWGGMLADRFDKRRLLQVTQASLAIVALSAGLVTIAGVVQFWHVLVFAVILGVITSVDSPVRQSFIVEMVGQENLPNALALNTATYNVARVFGPAVAGVAITSVGTAWAFLLNAASTVAVLTALALMRGEALRPAPKVARARGQVREGLRYVRSHSELVVSMLLIFVVSTFGLNFQLTTALLAREVFHEQAHGYGFLTMALGIGALVGAILAGRRTRRPSSLFLILSTFTFGLIEVLAGSMPTVLLTGIMLGIAGLAMMIFHNACSSSVQLGVDPAMRGRVMALYMMCSMGGTPLGAPLIGWAADALGPRWGMIGGGGVSTAAAIGLGLLLSRRPSYAWNR